MVEYCAPSQGEVKSNYRYCVPCGSTKSPLQGICRYRFPLTLPADQPYHWMESVVIMLEQLVVFLLLMLGPK